MGDDEEARCQGFERAKQIHARMQAALAAGVPLEECCNVDGTNGNAVGGAAGGGTALGNTGTDVTGAGSNGGSPAPGDGFGAGSGSGGSATGAAAMVSVRSARRSASVMASTDGGSTDGARRHPNHHHLNHALSPQSRATAAGRSSHHQHGSVTQQQQQQQQLGAAAAAASVQQQLETDDSQCPSTENLAGLAVGAATYGGGLSSAASMPFSSTTRLVLPGGYGSDDPSDSPCKPAAGLAAFLGVGGSGCDAQHDAAAVGDGALMDVEEAEGDALLLFSPLRSSFPSMHILPMIPGVATGVCAAVGSEYVAFGGTGAGAGGGPTTGAATQHGLSGQDSLHAALTRRLTLECDAAPSAPQQAVRQFGGWAGDDARPLAANHPYSAPLPAANTNVGSGAKAKVPGVAQRMPAHPAAADVDLGRCMEHCQDTADVVKTRRLLHVRRSGSKRYGCCWRGLYPEQ